MLTEDRGRMATTRIEARGITDPLWADGWTEGEQASCTSTF
jgi:hypothetical protein